MKLVGQTQSRYTGCHAFSRTVWECGRSRPPRRTAGACPGVPWVPPTGPVVPLASRRPALYAGHKPQVALYWYLAG